jgi:hypothetical protein
VTTTIQYSPGTHAYRTVTADANGTLYVTDDAAHTVYRIPNPPTTLITNIDAYLLAGSGTGAYGITDGTGTSARLDFSGGYYNAITVDSYGSVYVMNFHRTTNRLGIRKITASGVVSSLIGFTAGSDWTDGTGAAASFSDVHGLAVEPTGTIVHIMDCGDWCAIRALDVGTRTINTVSASMVNGGGYPNSPSVDGTGTNARFAGGGQPWGGLAVDSSGGAVYATDNAIYDDHGRDTCLIRKVVFAPTVFPTPPPSHQARRRRRARCRRRAPARRCRRPARAHRRRRAPARHRRRAPARRRQAR